MTYSITTFAVRGFYIFHLKKKFLNVVALVVTLCSSVAMLTAAALFRIDLGLEYNEDRKQELFLSVCKTFVSAEVVL